MNNRSTCVAIFLSLSVYALIGTPVSNAQQMRGDILTAQTVDARHVNIGYYDPESNSLRLLADRLHGLFKDGVSVDIFRILNMKDGLYLIREGKDNALNCVISRTPVSFSKNGSLVIAPGATTQTCAGFKCKKCPPPHENGCDPCKITTDPDGRCDHSITKGGIIKPEILLP